jgi:uncharacterized membrane protein
MDKETYNRIRAAVAVGISILMAYSVLKNSWALATGSVALGMIVLVLAKRQVDVVLYDERTKIVREKAANATLGIVTVGFAAVGLGLIETSFWGYAANRDLGYTFAYIAFIIMAINAFFNWYYNNQMGG